MSIGRIDDSQSSITGEYTLTGTLDMSGDSCLLPWGFDRLCWMPLGTQSKFLTYQLNGCGVLISGDRGSPVVVHANESGNNLNKSIQSDGTKVGEQHLS
ncbi:hypothetical protein [Methylomonas fluvii]|nr:hypothetical protein [Methylomonas fluvii]